MADKNLTELAWKAFSKGRDIKDAPLGKALADLAKSERTGPQAEIDALDSVDKLMAEVRSSKKSDKELQAFLDKMAKAADAQRKAAEKALKAAESESEDEDESESPALLTSKLVPLIRELRKGDLRMPTLIALAGKEAAVLVSRRAISPARGKILKEYLAASGGLKFIRGECVFEAGALTFIVQSTAGGLAKKLKAALLKQTELRLKVRVRGEDPDDIDEDEDEEGDGEGTEAGKVGKAAEGGEAIPQAGLQAPQAPDLQRDFERAVAEAAAMVKQVLQKKSPGYAAIATMFSSARDKGAAGDFAGAVTLLRELQQRVEESLAAAAVADKVAPADGGATADAASDKAKATATAELQARSDAFKSRLTGMLPSIKEASTRDPALAQALKQQIADAGAFARQRDFDQADAVLDRIAKALREPAGVNPSVAFNTRLAALLPRVKEVSTGRPDEASLLKIRVGVAGAKAKEKDFDAGHEVLDQIETMLEDFTRGSEEAEAEADSDTDPEADGLSASAERAEQARAEIEAATGKGHVRFQAMLLDWRQSMKRAESEIKRFADALSNHPLVVYDPRADEIRARAAELVSKLPRFDGSLEDALAAAADARGTEEIGPSRRAATAAVDAYLKALDGNALVRALEDTFVGSASIYSDMQRTLADLKRELSDA